MEEGFTMRRITRILLLSVSLAVTLVGVQATNIPQVQHVIIVIQENRTPDNLFGSDAFANPRQLPGADLVQTGQCYQVGPNTIQLQPMNLGNACNPDHGHGSWKSTYHAGFMDGACITKTYSCGNTTNPQYTYVQSSNVVPYFNIGKQYGYANYMFQTSQGPSFAAHQFLFSGTSAPDYFDDPNNNCGMNFSPLLGVVRRGEREYRSAIRMHRPRHGSK